MEDGKVLMTIAVIAVIVSAVGFFFSLGVFNSVVSLRLGPSQNQTGYANVSIVENFVMNLTVDTIDWGSGYVITGNSFAYLDSEGGLTNWHCVSPGPNFSPSSCLGVLDRGLTLENIGNQNASIYIKTEKNATEFICGIGSNCAPSSANYTYKVQNCNTATCTSESDPDLSPSCGSPSKPLATYYEVNSTNGVPDSTYLGDEVCAQFGTASNANAVRIDLNITIPAIGPVLNNQNGDVITISALKAP